MLHRLLFVTGAPRYKRVRFGAWCAPWARPPPRCHRGATTAAVGRIMGKAKGTLLEHGDAGFASNSRFHAPAPSRGLRRAARR